MHDTKNTMGHHNFLSKAYGVGGVTQTQHFYDEWAQSYDQEIIDNGYKTPARCAEALKKHAPHNNARILDIGCGTGLSGMALHHQGYNNIDGCDLSYDMLRQAKLRGDIYSKTY